MDFGCGVCSAIIDHVCACARLGQGRPAAAAPTAEGRRRSSVGRSACRGEHATKLPATQTDAGPGMASTRNQTRLISPGAAVRRLNSVANALSAPAAVEPAGASGSTALIAVSAALGGAAIAYSYDRYGYPRAPSSAVPVPGSSKHVASGQPEVEDKHDTVLHSEAQVGLPVEAVDTPALLIDMDALEHNIRNYASTMKGRGCIWRPHCKAVRSPELAHMLVDAGAVGVTCAKISQASALADGGIADILIANEIVGPAKVAALMDLAGKVDSLCVAVDDEAGLRAIADAAMAAGIENLDVLVDVNVGMNRCGIHWKNRKEIVRLSQLAETIQGVGFRGLMGYDGGEVATAISSAERLHAARNAVEAAGTAVKIISGAGSENYWIASGLGEGDSVWEIQGGGGVLCCQKYYNTFNTADDAPTHKYVCHRWTQGGRLFCQYACIASYHALDLHGKTHVPCDAAAYSCCG
eukprot:COSAG02_NODE_1099_length_14585_cov_19.264669_12_plen_467_part_00